MTDTYSVSDAMKMLGKSDSQIRRYLDMGVLRKEQVIPGGEIAIPWDSVARVITDMKEKAFGIGGEL